MTTLTKDCDNEMYQRILEQNKDQPSKINSNSM